MKTSPAFLHLDKYNISPADVVRMSFKCAPEAIRADVILAPVWKVEIFSQWADCITIVTPDVLYDLAYQGKTISFLRSGVGAPLAGDAVLALGCTPCERILFAGSVGGLRADMHIGDLMVPEFSYAGDGFCRYLQPGFPAKDCYLEHNAPDDGLSTSLCRVTVPQARQAGVRVHIGPVFSIDTILAQFSILDNVINDLGCIGIEMETAAVFKAASMVGLPAAALLSVSDIPVKNQSLFSGRPQEEKIYRGIVRSQVLARALLDCLK